MEQLKIILGKHGKRTEAPKISQNDKNDDIKEQIKATVLEASKSF